MDSLKATDAASAAVQKTPNRVTLEHLESNIVNEEYIHPELDPTMTIAILTVRNGFHVIGKSAPADPENFNAELGRKFAREDAIRQLWPLEAYALKERMATVAYRVNFDRRTQNDVAKIFELADLDNLGIVFQADQVEGLRFAGDE